MNNIRVYYKGKLYKNCKELCENMGVDLSIYYELALKLNEENLIAECIKQIEYKNQNKVITYNGKLYKNHNELVNDLGLSYNTYMAYRRKGLPVAEIVQKMQRANEGHVYTEVEYKGEIYKSLKELSKAEGIKYENFLSYHRTHSKDSLEEQVYNYKHNIETVTIGGKKYKTIKDFERKYNIKYTQFLEMRKQKKGKTVEEIIQEMQESAAHKRVRIQYNGKTYLTYKEALADLGINYSQFTSFKHIHLELSDEEILEAILKGNIEFRGKQYKTYKDLTKEYDIDYNQFISYRNSHKEQDLEEIITHLISIGKANK